MSKSLFKLRNRLLRLLDDFMLIFSFFVPLTVHLRTYSSSLSFLGNLYFNNFIITFIALSILWKTTNSYFWINLISQVINFLFEVAHIINFIVGKRTGIRMTVRQFREVTVDIRNLFIIFTYSLLGLLACLLEGLWLTWLRFLSLTPDRLERQHWILQYSFIYY